jgi:hypothetical protein
MAIHWNKSDVSAPVAPMLREAFDGAVHLTSSPQAMKHWHGADDNPLWDPTHTEAPSTDLIQGACGADRNANSGPGLAVLRRQVRPVSCDTATQRFRRMRKCNSAICSTLS